MNETFTLTEVAEYLKVSRKTVLRYVKERKIKAFKFGNNYRITKENLDKFYADNSLENEKNSIKK
ncbi:MAG: helix-turn-helix domain-containing protein [Firmicutes bacterium]|nr:helix-turn-helix domain-containing protein [Bacillota bacterium]